MKSSSPFRDQILERVRKQHRQQIQLRRQIHQYPETAFEEFRTTALIKKTIMSLGLKILPIKLKTGLLAELKGDGKGPTIALRADIDGLPIHELTNLPFKSKVDGRMHACGHDMHTAGLLGTAKVLTEMKEHLHGSVRFIFQPAEEQPPGGAQPMIENGALKGVSMIIGHHVDPHLPTGRIGLRDGVTMAAVIDFDLIIHGKGGHAARPQFAVDAIAAAAEVIDSIQKVVSREIDPIAPVVVTFGKIEGGTVRNVIADRVVITGTARALSPQAAMALPKLIKRTATNVCKARGAKAVMKILATYPTLSSDKKVNSLLSRNFKALFGGSKIAETPQTLGGEDFARYLQLVPGAFFRVGIQNKKIGATKSWHSSDFIADENALLCSTGMLVATTLDFLNGK